MIVLDLVKPGGGDGDSLVNICCRLSPFPILRDSVDLSTGQKSKSELSGVMYSWSVPLCNVGDVLCSIIVQSVDLLELCNNGQPSRSLLSGLCSAVTLFLFLSTVPVDG